MRVAAILIVLNTAITNTSQYRVHFHKEKTRGEKNLWLGDSNEGGCNFNNFFIQKLQKSPNIEKMQVHSVKRGENKRRKFVIRRFIWGWLQF